MTSTSGRGEERQPARSALRDGGVRIVALTGGMHEAKRAVLAKSLAYRPMVEAGAIAVPEDGPALGSSWMLTGADDVCLAIRAGDIVAGRIAEDGRALQARAGELRFVDVVSKRG